MRQKLVTKKNRKVRRLRELYPHVTVKILYRRDYRNLAAKYGLANGEEASRPTPIRTPGPPRVVRLG